MLSNKKFKKRKQPFFIRDEENMDDIQPRGKKKMPKQKYRHQRVWIERYEDDMEEELD